MEHRLTEALKLSEEILIGIELETLSIGSAALRCLRLARLVRDTDSATWLQYEISGYPKAAGGKNIPNDAFEVAYTHGRKRPGTDEKDTGLYIFSETAPELESLIATASAGAGTFSTQGAAVQGEWQQ